MVFPADELAACVTQDLTAATTCSRRFTALKASFPFCSTLTSQYCLSSCFAQAVTVRVIPLLQCEGEFNGKASSACCTLAFVDGWVLVFGIALGSACCVCGLFCVPQFCSFFTMSLRSSTFWTIKPP